MKFTELKGEMLAMIEEYFSTRQHIIGEYQENWWEIELNMLLDPYEDYEEEGEE
jgi:hypothetical protein